MRSLTELRERLQGAPDRARALYKMARSSGLVGNVHVAGALALVRAAMSGSQNPSQIYRFHALNTPNGRALVWRNEVLTFAELDARVDRIAGALRERGVRRGSSIALMMRNRSEYVLIAAAAGRIGAAAVAISWRSTADELSYLVNHCGAVALAFEASLAPAVEKARRALVNVPDRTLVSIGGETKGAVSFEELIAPRALYVAEEGSDEAAAVVVYTSGTTGKPKGAVRHFPRSAITGFLKFIAETPMRVDDVHLVTCPLYHSTAYAFLTLSHLLGNTVVIVDEFKPERFLELVEEQHVTTTATVPTMLHRLMQLGRVALDRRDTRSLRAVFTGGAPLPAALGQEVMDAFGDVLFNFYGATETGLVTLAKPHHLRAAPATIGTAIPGNQILLLREDGKPARVGEVGELYVKNDFSIAGYHKDEGATRESIKDGFFSVGDLARVDSEGRYFIEGRKRDMVISGGVNVYPAEVESTLEQHPELLEVAVIGVPDHEWGERVLAFVVRKTGSAVDDADLRLWTRERLSGPKIPRDFVFLDALPRNPTGKVLKRELRTYTVG